MSNPKDYEYSFTPDTWPISFDEVLGSRELCISFDFEPQDEVDMIKEGIHMAIFAKEEGDSEWEDISHLTDKKEDRFFVKMCFDFLEKNDE